MAAAPAPVMPHQFDIEIGPWDSTTGLPTRYVNMTPIRSNSTYTRCSLMRGMSVGVMYSPGGFFTQHIETPTDERSVWFINLQPIKIQLCAGVPTVANIASGVLNPPGNLWWMRWNHIYILQTADNRAVMLRVVDRNPQAVGTPPPMNYHNGDPILDLNPATHMPNLLSRLQTLTT